MEGPINYGGLDLDNDQIRLIKLHPYGNGHQQSRTSARNSDMTLLCDLESHTRGSCPPYIALSYAWGPQGSTLPIYINRKVCQISETVEQALRHLRHSRNKVYLWVDQICINQDDNEEKSRQVQQMRHIYREADVVICWLGLEFPDSKILFGHLERTGHAVLGRDWKSLNNLHSDGSHMTVIKNSFRFFCQRAYWKRLWIIQEYAVGRRVRIVCGESSIEARVIDAALKAQAFLDEGTQTQRMISRSLLQSLDEIFLPEERSFVDNVITRRQRFQLGDNKDHFLRVLATSLVLEEDYNFPVASDPRDRVFALLHLAKDTDDFDTFPDYTKSSEEVYYETALKFLRQGHIDILLYCQFPRILESLPTWVPDWSMEIFNPCAQPPWMCKFSASGETLSKQRVSESQVGSLGLQGISVDTVAEYGDLWNPNWSKPLDRRAALEFIDNILQLCKKSPRIRTDEEFLDAARIAAVDGAYYYLREPSGGRVLDDLVRYERGYDEMISGKSQEEEESWYEQALHRLHSRRPFITSSGWVGLCPSHLAAGDEVCIFFGGKTPYVVRPEEDNTYSLIGEAYVHGIMYGEFLKGNPVTKTFVLK